MAEQLERGFDNLMHVDWFEMRLGRPGESQELINERVDPIYLVSDQIGEGIAKIGVLIAFG